MGKRKTITRECGCKESYDRNGERDFMKTKRCQKHEKQHQSLKLGAGNPFN